MLDRQGVLNSERHDLTAVKAALARDTADRTARLAALIGGGDTWTIL